MPRVLLAGLVQGAGLLLGAAVAHRLAGGKGVAAVAAYALYRAGEDLSGPGTVTLPQFQQPDQTRART